MDNRHSFANADPLAGGKRFSECMYCFYCSKNKWKDRSFAAGVDREDIKHGCAELGVDLWGEHVPLVLEAMQEIAGELGLDGRMAQE